MERKRLEFTVGAFVLIGLFLLGGLIIYFGNFKERFQDSYELTVTFPNANGLLRDSMVRYAGAPVGRVVSEPKVIDEGRAVEVDVRVYDGVYIRENATWTIGSAGLLGDAFVEINPPLPPKSGQAPEPFLKNHDKVVGGRTAGIADLTQGVEPLLSRAGGIADELQAISTKLNEQILTEKNTKELSAAITDLREITAKINKAIQAKQLKRIMANFQTISRNLAKLTTRAGQGKGVLYEVLADKETGDNLATFIANLKKHGPIFYEDTEGQKKVRSRTSRSSRRRR